MMENQTNLLRYLKDLVKCQRAGADSDLHYGSMEEFLIENGQFFETQPLPPDYCEGDRGQCFENATKLLCDYEILRYVEGYASAGVHEHHAWCIDEHDRVVDNSPSQSANAGYFGVAFPENFVLDAATKAGYNGIFDNEEALQILLSRPFDPQTLGFHD